MFLFMAVTRRPPLAAKPQILNILDHHMLVEGFKFWVWFRGKICVSSVQFQFIDPKIKTRHDNQATQCKL